MLSRTPTCCSLRSHITRLLQCKLRRQQHTISAASHIARDVNRKREGPRELARSADAPTHIIRFGPDEQRWQEAKSSLAIDNSAFERQKQASDYRVLSNVIETLAVHGQIQRGLADSTSLVRSLAADFQQSGSFALAEYFRAAELKCIRAQDRYLRAHYCVAQEFDLRFRGSFWTQDVLIHDSLTCIRLVARQQYEINDLVSTGIDQHFDSPLARLATRIMAIEFEEPPGPFNHRTPVAPFRQMTGIIHRLYYAAKELLRSRMEENGSRSLQKQWTSIVDMNDIYVLKQRRAQNHLKDLCEYRAARWASPSLIKMASGSTLEYGLLNMLRVAYLEQIDEHRSSFDVFRWALDRRLDYECRIARGNYTESQLVAFKEIWALHKRAEWEAWGSFREVIQRHSQVLQFLDRQIANVLGYNYNRLQRDGVEVQLTRTLTRRKSEVLPSVYAAETSFEPAPGHSDTATTRHRASRIIRERLLAAELRSLLKLGQLRAHKQLQVADEHLGKEGF